MTLPLPTIAARIITVAGFSFSRTLAKLTKMIDAGNCSSTVVAAVISSDPVLTALSLGRANAGAAGDILQLSNATLLLGLENVRSLLEEVTVVQERSVRLLAGCWSHANATATMCRILADRAPAFAENRPDDEILHVAGLVHDLGTTTAAVHFTAEYDTAITRLRRGEGPFAVLLKEELGADPCELGALVAKAWNVPPPYVTVIRHHLRPQRAEPHLALLTSLVHVARQLTRGCGFCSGHDQWVEPIDEHALVALGIKPAVLPGALDAFFAEMDDLELYEGLLIRSVRA